MAKVIPARLRVGPHRYKVEVARPSGLSHEEYGCTDIGRTVISLAPGMSKTMQRDTLLHESLHALLDVTGWAHRLGTKKEEQLVRSLTPALLQFLRDNKEVVEWMTK